MICLLVPVQSAAGTHASSVNTPGTAPKVPQQTAPRAQSSGPSQNALAEKGIEQVPPGGMQVA